MSTKIETLDQARALIGKRVVIAGMRSAKPGLVTSCGEHHGEPWIGLDHHENPDKTYVVAPARVLFLPFTLADAGEPDGAHAPATEARVRTTIRAALDHAGARVPFTMNETEPGAWAVEARRDGQWAVNGGVDGSTLLGLQQTAESFAREVALAMEALGQCPTCQTFPMLCEFHGEQNTRGLADADEASAPVEARGEQPASERTPLPPGWRWDGSSTCAADCGDEWVLLETIGPEIGEIADQHGVQVGDSPIRDAIEAEARRLGLPVRPPGYQWRIRLGSVCVARQGHGVWSWVYPFGAYDGTWVVQPEHRAALDFAVAVLRRQRERSQ